MVSMIQKRIQEDSLDCHTDMSSVSTVSRRSEPSSRSALMGEQTNPWDLLQPQDALSRPKNYYLNLSISYLICFHSITRWYGLYLS